MRLLMILCLASLPSDLALRVTAGANAASITSIVYHTSYTPAQTVSVWKGLTASITVNGPGVARAVEIVRTDGGPASGLTVGVNSFRSIPSPQLILALSSSGSAALGTYRVRIHYPLSRTGGTLPTDSFTVRLFDRGTVTSITKDAGSASNTSVGDRHHFTANGTGLANATISAATLGSLVSDVQVASRTASQVRFSFVPKAATSALDVTAGDFFDQTMPNVAGDGPWGYGGAGTLRLTTTIKPTKITFAAANAVEGQQLGATVTMSGPVASGATAVVALQSSSAYATVPPQAIVSGTTATFAVTVLAGAASKQATITATSGGVSISAPLSVLSSDATLRTLQFLPVSTPQTMTNGANDYLQMQVILAAPAGAAGETVQLSATPPGAVVIPPSVTVPGGETGVLWRITANPTDVDQQVTISATLRQVTLTRSVTVLKPVPKSIDIIQSYLASGFTADNPGIWADRSVMPVFRLSGRVASPLAMQVSTTRPDLLPWPGSVTVASSGDMVSPLVGVGKTTTDQVVTVTATSQGRSVSRQITVLRHPWVTSLQLQQSPSLHLLANVDRRPPSGFVVAISNDNPGRLELPATQNFGSGTARAITATIKVSSGVPTVTSIANNVLEYRVSSPIDTIGAIANVRVRAADSTTSADAGVGISLQLRPYILALSIAISGSATAPLMTVSINAAAPGSGAVVSLSKSGTNPERVTIPATVSIPGGTRSTTFPITLATGQNMSGIVFSASYSGVTTSVTVP
jgi:hypothetical protein